MRYALIGLLTLGGCSGAVYGPALDKALALCRQEFRETYQRTGEANHALNVYERCKLREGAY